MKRVINFTIFFVAAYLITGLPIVNAQSPNLFFSSAKKVSVGGNIAVTVRVQSSTQPINAISGSIALPESLVSVSSVSKNGSVIDLWVGEPRVSRNVISFEGVILNPGFQGGSANVFTINFTPKRTGIAKVNFTDGAILANDGRGTNILTQLGSTSFEIVEGISIPTEETPSTFEPGTSRLPALPIITEYSTPVDAIGRAYLKGKGEPNALTKIVFKDISFKSLGEKFIEFLQTEKKKLDEVLVKNDNSGNFEYLSQDSLIGGAYNATPFLVDNESNTEKPGLGVQFFVSDSQIVKFLVIVINVLGLLIPIVGLIVIIYFIPWYSWRRMRVLKKKLGLEEEKIEISGHQLQRQEKIADSTIDRVVSPITPPQSTPPNLPQ